MLSDKASTVESFITAKPPGRLTLRRVRRGLTQSQVEAALCHLHGERVVARDVLSRIENGRAWPGPLVFTALAGLYGASPTEIFEEVLEAWHTAREVASS